MKLWYDMGFVRRLSVGMRGGTGSDGSCVWGRVHSGLWEGIGK
jgi:hypothetical protein